MSEQGSKLPSQPQRPTTSDRNAWYAYWKAQGQTWRNEIEIDIMRQIFLDECLAVIPDTEQRYSFRNIELSRADLEWLLVAYHRGRKIYWSHAYDDGRYSLDLRGADLHKISMRRFPMKGVDLFEAHLEGADLYEAHLEGSRLKEAHLKRANLRAAYQEGASLEGTNLEEASLGFAHLERANLGRANLKGTSLEYAHLEGADLREAHLEGAKLIGAHLEGADLREAHLEGAYLRETHLEGSDLRGAFFDTATHLDNIILGDEKYGFVSLANVRWGGVNLSEIDWAPPITLGDEWLADWRKKTYGNEQKSTWLHEFQLAVQANRQLALVLQSQGLNTAATRFAYHAQVLERKVIWQRLRMPWSSVWKTGIWKWIKMFGAYIFSLMLDKLAGYGYKPQRSIIAYLLVVVGFAIAYYSLGQTVGPQLSPLGALVFSVTSFHGRGFFPGGIQLDDPLTVLAALEAVVGFTIEVSLIASFTLRFFGK